MFATTGVNAGTSASVLIAPFNDLERVRQIVELGFESFEPFFWQTMNKDLPLLAKQLISALRGAGYAVDHAADGQRADLLGHDEPYDAVVLDLGLPKVDGLEVLHQIKSDDRLKMIPVVVLTSSREERDMMRSYQLGVNAYVVKPVDFHEFVNAVRELGVFWAVINQPPPGSVKKVL